MINQEQIKKLKTPCYIYDREVLTKRIQYIRNTFGNQCRLCYSMKANPVLLQYIDKLVDRIEVCSHGEFKICVELGISPAKILYTGVNKRYYEICEALDCGVTIFNVESLHQLELLKEAAKRKEKYIHTYLRISSGNQFGMSMSDIDIAFKRVNTSEYLEVIGVHFFAGTAVSEKKRKKQLSFLKDCISNVRKYFKAGRLEIEYGPGLPTRYFIDEEEDLSEKAMVSCMEALSDVMDLENEVWTIEMGRYIVADCGNYLTSVEDIKEVEDVSYLIVDGGINHLNYYGQTMALRIPDMCMPMKEDSELQKYWICGSLCTTADVLVKNGVLPKAEFEDKILFKNCGAYSNTEANYLFLSRDMPYSYLYDEDEKFHLIKDSKTTFNLNKAD